MIQPERVPSIKSSFGDHICSWSVVYKCIQGGEGSNIYKLRAFLARRGPLNQFAPWNMLNDVRQQVKNDL